MDDKKLRHKYLPMTETAYYILLSLLGPRHGYGIMQHVWKLTGGRIKIGAGTIYGTLSKLEEDKLIAPVAEEERRKIYKITGSGTRLLRLELARLRELVEHGKAEMEEIECGTTGTRLRVDNGRYGPALEEVHYFYDQWPVGFAVSSTGRIFVSYYPGDYAYTLGEVVNATAERPYPGPEWNVPPK